MSENARSSDTVWLYVYSLLTFTNPMLPKLVIVTVPLGSVLSRVTVVLGLNEFPKLSVTLADNVFVPSLRVLFELTL